MLGHELLQSHEEASFEREEALDGCRTSTASAPSSCDSLEKSGNAQLRRPSHGMPHPINSKRKHIGYHSNKYHELPKLLATPRALKVFPSKPYHAPADSQTEEVVLDPRRRYEGPGIADALRGYESKVGDGPLGAGEVVGAHYHGFGGRHGVELVAPLVEAEGSIEDGEGDVDEEQSAGQGWKVDSRRHVGMEVGDGGRRGDMVISSHRDCGHPLGGDVQRCCFQGKQ